MIEVKQAWDAVDIDCNEQDPEKSTYTVYYIVSGSEVEGDIVANVQSETPDKYNGIPRQAILITERLTTEDWKVEVRYSNNSSGDASVVDDPEQSSYDFDISATTKKIIIPIKHKRTFPNTASAPMAGINDGEGIDIIMPCHRFSETHFLSDSKCNGLFKKRVGELVGTINKKAFKSYPQHHVLFLGAMGSRIGNNKWQVTFKFAVAYPEKEITIGNISGIEKDPWDVIWCQYTEGVSDNQKEIIRKVKAVHVDQVYKISDFGILGI